MKQFATTLRSTLGPSVRMTVAAMLMFLLAAPSPAQNKPSQTPAQSPTPAGTSPGKDFTGVRVIPGGENPQAQEGNGKSAPQKGQDQSAQQGQPATVQRTGDVKVGTQSGDKTTTVFVGDTVETSSNSAAVITTEGSTVYVPSNTSVVYGNNVVSVGCGGAVVSTVTGMTSNIMNTGISVTPENDYSRYEVNQTNGTIQIASREGSVLVKNGAKLMTLAAGASVTFAGAACFVPPALVFPTTSIVGVSAAAASGTVVGIKVIGPITPAHP